jgi:hypothetical protein
MDMLYVPPFNRLATGGSIGDALFFFCSGFTLFLGRMGRFDNWYKRRINRIYPTVFAVAILSTIFFHRNSNIIDIILHGGSAFVSCIMIYYVVFYFVRKYMLYKLPLAFGAFAFIVVVLYGILTVQGNYWPEIDDFDVNKWITQSNFKWVYFFLFMLAGAMLGSSQQQRQYKFFPDFIKLLVCTVLWYGVFYAATKIEIISKLQIISLPLLFGIIYYLYKVCNSRLLAKIYNYKYASAIIKTVGGLCLEIYLVQNDLFTDKMNSIFPLNIVIMFMAIVIVAYILRCLSRIFSQTFKGDDYNWKEVFKVY